MIALLNREIAKNKKYNKIDLEKKDDKIRINNR